ncbi:hypothetical protein OQ641_27635, partial [Klebsiella pneumoniae]|nr:hypothetical protein [Klebsiella pneumoniae]
NIFSGAEKAKPAEVQVEKNAEEKPERQREVRHRHQASGPVVSTAITAWRGADSPCVARNTGRGGLGVAMVSSWTVMEDSAAGRRIELFPQWRPASLPVHLGYPWGWYYP